MNKSAHLLFVLLLMSSGFGGIIITIPSNVSAYTPHDPISINGDADFAEQAASEGWPGDGSEGNPYVIEGIEINATHDWDIRIKSTTVYFIINNSILGNYGIFFDRVSHGTINNCTLGGTSLYFGGILIYLSSQNTITNNNISGIGEGIELSYSMEHTINNNSMKNGGINIEGDRIDHWLSHDIDSSNTVNGKPVYYWKNRNGGMIPLDAGQVILVNCKNVIVENISMTHSSPGIQLGYSANNIIRNIFYSPNGFSIEYGIHLINSDENMIHNNSVEKSYFGIYVDVNSSYNKIWNNNISNNTNGIILYTNTRGNNISNNYISNNSDGISLFDSWENNVFDNVFRFFSKFR